MNFEIDAEPHELRIIFELKELKDKIDKLNSFIKENPIFHRLEEIDQDLLENQFYYMRCYVKILTKRIKRFKNRPNKLI